mgnify:CR=1 FL=1
MVISRMYSEKCGYRDGVARIVTISGGGCRKLMDPVWCSEKVLNPEMRGDPSSDSEYRTGFVWNPGRRAKICSISALGTPGKCDFRAISGIWWSGGGVSVAKYVWGIRKLRKSLHRIRHGSGPSLSRGSGLAFLAWGRTNV